MSSSFTPYHFGLFFTAQHVRQAQQNAAREPFASAWAFLNTHQPQDTLYAAQGSALRWRFGGSDDEAVAALARLAQVLDDDAELPLLDGIGHAVITVQTFEMLRDHPSASPSLQARVVDWLYERVGSLNEAVYEQSYVESLWLALITLVTGIVLEREPIFQRGAQVFMATIADDISPRGHIERAVKAGDGSAMTRTLQAVSALVLMAEAAAHVGVDLWRYQVRGVSVATAAIYPIYYFYVTDKWTWEAIEPDAVQAAFRAHGGYLELLYRQSGVKDLLPLLDELRPIYDPLAGGLPTLSHAPPQRARGLFK
jgi:hypothetical protein